MLSHRSQVVARRIGEADMREVHWEDDILRVRAFGQVTSKALLQGARELTADPRYDSLQFIVVDFLDADLSTSSFLGIVDDLLAVLIGSSYANANVRIAVIAQDHHILDLTEALGRFKSEPMPQIFAFCTRASVAEWIAQQPRLNKPPMRFRPR